MYGEDLKCRQGGYGGDVKCRQGGYGDKVDMVEM